MTTKTMVAMSVLLGACGGEPFDALGAFGPGGGAGGRAGMGGSVIAAGSGGGSGTAGAGIAGRPVAGGDGGTAGAGGSMAGKAGTGATGGSTAGAGGTASTGGVGGIAGTSGGVSGTSGAAGSGGAVQTCNLGNLFPAGALANPTGAGVVLDCDETTTFAFQQGQGFSIWMPVPIQPTAIIIRGTFAAGEVRIHKADASGIGKDPVGTTTAVGGPAVLTINVLAGDYSEVLGILPDGTVVADVVWK